jgi:hypothetical protein
MGGIDGVEYGGRRYLNAIGASVISHFDFCTITPRPSFWTSDLKLYILWIECGRRCALR